MEGLHGEGSFSELLCPANPPGSTERAVSVWMSSSDQLLYQNQESTRVRRLLSYSTGPLTPSIPEELLGGCSVARGSVAEQRVFWAPCHLPVACRSFKLIPVLSAHLLTFRTHQHPSIPSSPQKGGLGGSMGCSPQSSSPARGIASEGQPAERFPGSLMRS